MPGPPLQTVSTNRSLPGKSLKTIGEALRLRFWGQEGDTIPQEHERGVKHLPSLDGLRAASILLVIAAHTLPLGPNALQLNYMAGMMGMSLFFCLSGYLITTTLLQRPEVWPFLVKRVFRIVPSLWLFLVLLIVFLGVQWQNAILNALFVSNYVEGGLSDGPTGALWSLCVEMHFYAVIALLVWLLGLRGVYLIPVMALVVTAVRIQQGVHVNIATHLRVDEILSGGCLALVLHNWSAQIKGWLDRTGSGLGLLILATGLWLLSCHPDGGAANYLRPYFTAAMVGLVLFAAPRVLQDSLASRPARYIAQISYALYIYHGLIMWGWLNEGSTEVRYLVKRPIGFTVTLLAAHLSTFYWEAFWQRFARQRILKEPARQPTAPSASQGRSSPESS